MIKIDKFSQFFVLLRIKKRFVPEDLKMAMVFYTFALRWKTVACKKVLNCSLTR
jgi:hypothetical protein